MEASETRLQPRSRSFRLLLALLPGLAFIALLWFALARTGSQAVLGNVAPSFELELLDGSGVLTDEDLKGKPVVINFWASWCIPCREEAPLLEKTWRAYKDDGVIFLGVSIKDAESDAKRFVDEFGITYPTVRDLDQSLTKDFGVKGLPETFFVDHRWTFIGAVSGAQAGDQQGTAILGAISEDELVSSVEILIRRMSSESEEQ
ncbi:MAG: TlpA family protein disulfide reductase [Actinomycetota bacterium]|nr:TlpA family protein disulfide reductase [Actinomycetota bacterium]